MNFSGKDPIFSIAALSWAESELRIMDSTFSGRLSCNQQNGDLPFEEECQAVVVAEGVNCTLKRVNFSNLGSGAFSSVEGFVTMEDCTFVDITESAVQIDNSGGVLQSSDETLFHPANLTNCSFDNCKCEKGGAIHILPNSHVLIDSCEFV